MIAIIAILAAMLLPALNRARETARKSNCLSNLKQLMLCRQNYAMDHGEWMLTFFTNGELWKPYRTLGYLTNVNITQCPGRPPFPVHSWTTTYGAKSDVNSSNGGLLSPVCSSGGDTWQFVASKNIRQPSKYFQDGDSRRPNDERQISYVNTKAAGALGRFFLVHRGRMNANFFDGHAADMDGMQYLSNFACDFPNLYKASGGTWFYWLDGGGILRSKWQGN